VALPLKMLETACKRYSIGTTGYHTMEIKLASFPPFLALAHESQVSSHTKGISIDIEEIRKVPRDNDKRLY
jgi:hypothetical protein